MCRYKERSVSGEILSSNNHETNFSSGAILTPGAEHSPILISSQRVRMKIQRYGAGTARIGTAPNPINRT